VRHYQGIERGNSANIRGLCASFEEKKRLKSATVLFVKKKEKRDGTTGKRTRYECERTLPLLPHTRGMVLGGGKKRSPKRGFGGLEGGGPQGSCRVWRGNQGRQAVQEGARSARRVLKGFQSAIAQ